MPNMDGPTAVLEMRKLGYRGKIVGVTGDIHIIIVIYSWYTIHAHFLSLYPIRTKGISLKEDKKHFLSAGADCVLLKPFDIDKFETLMLRFWGACMKSFAKYLSYDILKDDSGNFVLA